MSLESSAKARGDLDLANDAQYRLQELSAADDMLPQRVADLSLYQYGAGYLRTEILLFWLIVIVLAATGHPLRTLTGSQRRAQKGEADVAASGPGEGKPPMGDTAPNSNAGNRPGNREDQPRPPDATNVSTWRSVRARASPTPSSGHSH